MLDSPVFVLATARSGSTLLRFILDSHPALACPPETGVSAACRHLLHTLTLLDRGEPHQMVRNAIDSAYQGYLDQHGKKRWCDKSLDNVSAAPMLAELFPGARFICLYRHSMDMIASAIEACPWGLRKFGFEPFVAQHPGNNVAALGQYWLTGTSAILDFETGHQASCFRVRYEDLVTRPEETATALFGFLGEEPAPGVTSRCFRRQHDRGPGDQKIWFTSGVTSSSVGRGASVPVAELPGLLRIAINAVLGKLGYQTLHDGWGTALGAEVTEGGPRPGGQERADVRTAMDAISARIRLRRPGELAEIARRWPLLAGTSARLIVRAGPGWGEELKVTFGVPDGSTPESVGSDRLPVIAGLTGTWMSVLAGDANMSAELLSGRLVCSNVSHAGRVHPDVAFAVSALLGLTPVSGSEDPLEDT